MRKNELYIVILCKLNFFLSVANTLPVSTLGVLASKAILKKLHERNNLHNITTVEPLNKGHFGSSLFCPLYRGCPLLGG